MKKFILLIYIACSSMFLFGQLKVDSPRQVESYGLSSSNKLHNEADDGIYLKMTEDIYHLNSNGKITLQPDYSSCYDVVHFSVNSNEPLFTTSSPYAGYIGKSDNPWYELHSYKIYNTSLFQISDERKMENITNISGALDKINLIRGVIFDYKPELFDSNERKKELLINEGKNKYGFVAQEIKDVFPETIDYNIDEDIYSVNINAFLPILVEAVKEQQDMIRKLEKEISLLKSGISGQVKSNYTPLDIDSRKLNIEKIASLHDCIENPENPVLFQNTPNPFNSDTEIRFYVPENVVDAKLYIYSMQGAQIKSLSVKQRGSVTEIIHGAELQPGIYMYTLIADDREVDTKRMILTD